MNLNKIYKKINYEFNVEKVESTLFQMVGLLIDQNENEPTEICQETIINLTSEQKQEFYVSARAPVLKLQEDFNKIYLELSTIGKIF